MYRTLLGIPVIVLFAAPAAGQQAPGAPASAAPPLPSAGATGSFPLEAPPPSPAPTSESTAPVASGAPANEPPPPVVSAAPVNEPPAARTEPPPDMSEGWYDRSEPGSSDDPAVRRKKGVREHDGLYLRLSLDAGYLSAGVDSREDFRVRGPAIGIDLMIGGTPARGFVVGGGYVIDIASSPTVATSQEKFRANATLSASTLGVFADWFFDPSGGFHAGALAGYSTSRFTVDEINAEAVATGVGGSVFTGYDAWVADQWTIGVLVRATGSALSSSEGGVEESVYPGSIMVALTALNH